MTPGMIFSPDVERFIAENREALEKSGWRRPQRASLAPPPKRSEPLGLTLPLSATQQRDIIKADLLGKYQREDWHGVMDCAADLREHDAQMRGYIAGESSVS